MSSTIAAHVVDHAHGDRRLRALGGTQLAPHLAAGARAQRLVDIVLETLEFDAERGHGHAGHAGESGVLQALQRCAVLGRELLQHDHDAVQFPRHPAQRTRQQLGRRGLRQIAAVEVTLARRASHHQGARAHEARPQPPDAGDQALGVPVGAGGEVLVDDEVGLDRADILAAAGDEVPVIESVHRVFEKLVKATVLALAGERGLPARQGCDLVARRNPNRSACQRGRRQFDATNAPVHLSTPV